MDRLDMYLVEHTKLAIPEKITILEHYRCQKCKDTGWLTSYDGGYEVMKRCGCYTVKRARELIERSGLSAEFLKKSFDSFDTKGNPVLVYAKNKALDYVKNFNKIRYNRRNSIMFCGQPGSGKTHLGTAICSNLASKGIPVIYMPYRNTITRIKQNITDEAKYGKETRRYMDTAVLYIDDMLKGRLTEADVNIMYEVVNYRYINNLPLIVSTEKDLDGLLVFDEAVGSRIIEMCKDYIVQLHGKNLNYRMN